MVARYKNTPAIVILGPTASGKTVLSIDIANKINGEIICADSWTVRKYLDIGTAKPTIPEQNQIKHYMLDIIEPCETFNAALFKTKTNNLVNLISKKNKIPIISGGSGLYIYGWLYDYQFTIGDLTKRNELKTKSLEELKTLASKLSLDYSNYDHINRRRLIRLIETNGTKSSKSELRQSTLIIGLNPSPEILKQNIKNRVNQMINSGLEDEVKFLSEKYGWDCEGLKGINYAEWRPYLNHEIDLSELKKRLYYSNLHLAKKQYTWFKRNQDINWFESVQYDQINSLVDNFLKQQTS